MLQSNASIPMSSTTGYSNNNKRWEPKLTVPVSPQLSAAYVNFYQILKCLYSSRRRHCACCTEIDEHKHHMEHRHSKLQNTGFQLGQLTVPESPTFHTESRLKRKLPVETTEEMQLRIAREKIEEENKRRKLQEKMRFKSLVRNQKENSKNFPEKILLLFFTYFYFILFLFLSSYFFLI